MRSNNFAFDLAFQRDSRPTEVADRGGQRLCLTFEDGDFELESKGIPGRRLRHLAEDCGLEIEGLEEASLLLLRFECAIRSLPFAVLLDRQELSTCLLAVALWDVLPHSELRRELRHWGLANGGTQKTGQTTQLVDALWTSLAEARRVPVRRFAPHVGLALVGKAVRLEASCSQLVEGEYRRTMRRLGLPADAPPQSHIQCIMLALVLEEASMMQLKEECRFLKLEATNRPALQQHLFVETLCRQRWEDEGLSVSRLGYEAAIRVKLRWQQLELMDGRQLLDTWQAQGFTDEIQVSDMREKLKATALWKEMPVALLQEECRDLGLPIGTSESELLAQLTNAKSLSQNQVSSWEAKGVPLQRLGSQQDRIALVLRLETLETLSHPELRREYQEATALPPQAASVPEEPGELIQRLRQIYIWKALPLNQLRSECHDLGISQHLEVAQPEEKHQELLERLLLRWADRWKEEGIPLRRFRNLRSATNFADKVAQVVAGESGLQHQLAAASGLPQDAFGPMGKQELIKHMKDVFLWKELSVDELREECLQRSLSWRAEGGQEKLELLERLVMACCAQAWEDQGLPVKRLSSAHAAQQLLERWRQLDACGVEELRGEYQRLALPGSPKVLELLVRLRQHALWAALPLSELQRECRQMGADVTSHDEAVHRLAMSWDPRSETPDFWKTQEGKEAVGPKPSPALQRVARHFQTLGLPATATPEDLKRAYRRLVLQYHPDKNRAEISAEKANEKFREISEAHEAIVEFMKMEN